MDATLIVDAMNVIGSRPDGWWKDRDGAVRAFAARLRDHAHAHAIAIELVIDGPAIEDLPPGPDGPLRIVYAPRPGSDAADDRIVELLGTHDGPVTVVTADRELRERVRAGGADVLGPRAFLRRLAEHGDA